SATNNMDTGTVTVVAGCGDDVVDPGEDCEVSQDCCTASCTFAAAGTPCGDDGTFCTVDTCADGGVCTHVFASDAGCLGAVPGKGIIQLSKSADPTKDKLVWKWKSTVSLTVSDFGSPTESGTSYTMCVADAAGDLLLDLNVPAGASWTKSAANFTYKSTLL